MKEAYKVILVFIAILVLLYLVIMLKELFERDKLDDIEVVGIVEEPFT